MHHGVCFESGRERAPFRIGDVWCENEELTAQQHFACDVFAMLLLHVYEAHFVFEARAGACGAAAAISRLRGVLSEFDKSVMRDKESACRAAENNHAGAFPCEPGVHAVSCSDADLVAISDNLAVARSRFLGVSCEHLHLSVFLGDSGDRGLCVRMVRAFRGPEVAFVAGIVGGPASDVLARIIP